MALPLKEVEREALLLSHEDRELLAERLFESLGDAFEPAIDPVWFQVAERRYQEYKSGKVEGVSHDQLVADIRRNLDSCK